MVQNVGVRLSLSENQNLIKPEFVCVASRPKQHFITESLATL